MDTKLKTWMDDHLIETTKLAKRLGVCRVSLYRKRTEGIYRMYDAMAYAYALNCDVADIMETVTSVSKRKTHQC